MANSLSDCRPMPDETRAIEPALTPEEWKRFRKSPGLWCDEVGHTADDCFENMAINNAALPDGDPRKITREDVVLLAQAADTWENEGGDPSQLHILAAKLAALLAPEG
jgi:hypothetical protein